MCHDPPAQPAGVAGRSPDGDLGTAKHAPIAVGGTSRSVRRPPAADQAASRRGEASMRKYSATFCDYNTINSMLMENIENIKQCMSAHVPPEN